MIKLNDVVIKPTIFPDGTSQIWKIDPDLFKLQYTPHIMWEFENESELIHVLQLATLCKKLECRPYLQIPFLPYGRQDKEVSNETTFGLSVFLHILESTNLFIKILTIDAHNPHVIGDIRNISADPYIQESIRQCAPTMICFPDKGATVRGYTTGGLPSFYLDKKRNQSTGEIEGLKYEGDMSLQNEHVLIIDDLCDGGRTFIEASKLLYSKGAASVCLFTTHGIYSKGVQVLRDAGIKRIFNHKGEV